MSYTKFRQQYQSAKRSVVVPQTEEISCQISKFPNKKVYKSHQNFPSVGYPHHSLNLLVYPNWSFELCHFSTMLSSQVPVVVFELSGRDALFRFKYKIWKQDENEMGKYTQPAKSLKSNTGGDSFCWIGIQYAMPYSQKYTPPHCFFCNLAGWVVLLNLWVCNVMS